MDEFPSRLFGDLTTVVIVIPALLLTLAEAGYRLGRRLFTSGDDAHRRQIGPVQGAVVGLLGLLLAFTFSMAVTRYDARRGLVVKEANAIGTTSLRASLLPEAHRQVVRDLLRDYVDNRLQTQAASGDPALLAEGLRRSAEIQSKLWQRAEASATEAPNDITATFIESLNGMIDTGAERVAASRARIPIGVWLILVVVTAVGCFTSAYGSGSYGVRSPFTSLLLPLLISVVMLLIVDLMHGRQGLITVSQQPLIDLQNTLNSGPKK